MKKKKDIKVDVYVKKDGKYIDIDKLNKDELTKIATAINANGLRALGYEVPA